ncbi:MAG: alanyl-tRNA editing protein, partial [bacterium]
MTERIYYKDPNILEFEANIVETGKKGDNYYTVLDKTAFYPTSGGQLYDTGKLNDISVIEVIENNDHILHLTDKEVGKTGGAVRGKIDKQRRQINRQNHTAQHILSQVFFRLFNFVTVSVHLGEQYGAIELNIDKIKQEQLKESEMLANDMVSSNLDIEILFIDSGELNKYPMRKIPERKGTIRIIKIGEFEYSACGGTHCNGTAEVGLIKITDTEMMRNHVLVKFLSGSLAVDDYMKRYDVTYKLATDMTCHYSDLIG